MNKAFLTIGIILMAILGFYSITVITSQQTGSELDYYLLKETTEASMNDAIDIKYYREFGSLRMDKEKFMESFVKRFAVAVDGTREYRIQVYDINETPPKVSIRVTSPKRTDGLIKSLGGDKQSFDITTNADMILETKYKDNIAIENQNKEYIKDLRISSVNDIK